ncbi:MAG: hypothetical protein HC857_06405, partial [Synechococcales cyanobacterium RU_4_20]|nr:hypothetical protein [Synechococcales cyanobacterium RU_4_20]
QPTNQSLSNAIAPEVERLGALLQKLDQGLVRIAVFGLVSRGKSALLNALVGEKILETGPINGVTLEPQTVAWPSSAQSGPAQSGRSESSDPLQVELIDTPGLDEIGGQARADMAQSVAEQADLILFVLAGDMTRKELQAIRRLWRFQKPLLLVFNKRICTRLLIADPLSKISSSIWLKTAPIAPTPSSYAISCRWPPILLRSRFKPNGPTVASPKPGNCRRPKLQNCAIAPQPPRGRRPRPAGAQCPCAKP